MFVYFLKLDVFKIYSRNVFVCNVLALNLCLINANRMIIGEIGRYCIQINNTHERRFEWQLFWCHKRWAMMQIQKYAIFITQPRHPHNPHFSDYKPGLNSGHGKLKHGIKYELWPTSRPSWQGWMSACTFVNKTYSWAAERSQSVTNYVIYPQFNPNRLFATSNANHFSLMDPIVKGMLWF